METGSRVGDSHISKLEIGEFPSCLQRLFGLGGQGTCAFLPIRGPTCHTPIPSKGSNTWASGCNPERKLTLNWPGDVQTTKGKNRETLAKLSSCQVCKSSRLFTICSELTRLQTEKACSTSTAANSKAFFTKQAQGSKKIRVMRFPKVCCVTPSC